MPIDKTQPAGQSNLVALEWLGVAAALSTEVLHFLHNVTADSDDPTAKRIRDVLPAKGDSYAALQTLMLRAKESGDPMLYAQAEAALKELDAVDTSRGL